MSDCDTCSSDDFLPEEEGGVIITHYPGKIYLDLETGEFTGTAEEGE